MSQFVETVIQHLSPFGSITARKMFGGYGVYKDGVIIALIADDIIYLKASPETEPYFELFGSKPFVYEGKNRPVKMSYWEVVPQVWDSHALLHKWVTLAYETSIASNAKKAKRQAHLKNSSRV